MTESHRRFNPLNGNWVIVSPDRVLRPWAGEQHPPRFKPALAYDPGCYLCPGNTRADGTKNPGYRKTFVFENDFPALTREQPEAGANLPDPSRTDERDDTLFRKESATGTCRVICYSPQHHLTMADMDESAILDIVCLWQSQTDELSHRYHWVQCFENKGEMMGCSSPHPHGQIWACNFLPCEAQREDTNQREYYRRHGTTLLADYVARELRSGDRVVYHNDDWLVVVPWWATWPFETLLLPLQSTASLTQLHSGQRASLAGALKAITAKYDNLFQASFPYSMGWHGAPGNPRSGESCPWHLHAHFYPPLLRSATVKKFMAGFEMVAETQRDLTPESAAGMLRALPDHLYRI